MGTSSSGAPGADPEKDDIFNACCTDADDDDAYISFSIFGYSLFLDWLIQTVVARFLGLYVFGKQAIAGLTGSCCVIYEISEMGTYSRQ